MEHKFNVGDKVKIVSDGRIGKILTVLFDSNNGLRYRIEMNSVDFVANEVISGAVTMTEDNLEKVKEKVKESENDE